MKKTSIIIIVLSQLFFLKQAIAQTCKTNADVENVPGKYLTAAQYPWPAARAEYFNKLSAAADKAIAKKMLNQIEQIEAGSHTGFNLTGGDWENYYSTEGYEYYGNSKLGKYTFQSSLHEYFCLNGKLKRNDEYETVLRIYVNSIPFNTLSLFLSNPFGSNMGEYDFGFQFVDWKNHKPADVNAQLISLFTYLSCNNNQLIEKINSGNDYFQDIAEKDIKPNNRSNMIYRYWFIKRSNQPLLIPVSRKEYLQSLLEYYEREKLYFPKLMTELKGSTSAKQYITWEKDVADKIDLVKKALNEHDQNWLSEQAVINRMEDASQNYKSNLKERTNYNRFWKFYDNEKKSEPLYKCNPVYFKTTAGSTATPLLMTVAFRYVSMPLSLKIMNNFSEHFDFDALRNLLK